MIQEQEQIEQPGKNAVQHGCEMWVKDLDDVDREIRCGILALLQCDECAAWICGTEELEHAIICVRCSKPFCAECFPNHRLRNECQEVAA